MHSVEAYRAALDALPPLTRLIFALYRFDDLSYAEIGDQLAIDIDTVMDFVAEALAMMVTILDRAPPSHLACHRPRLAWLPPTPGYPRR